MSRLRNIDYRHWICLAISLIFLSTCFWWFVHAGARIGESFIDIGTSSVYYFCKLFDIHLPFDVTVNDFTKLPFEMPFNLPATWEEFKELFVAYWKAWISWDNFQAYLAFVSSGIYYFSKLLLVAMPLVITLIMAIHLRESKINNDYNKDSKGLKWWKRNIEHKVYLPCKAWLQEFNQFLKDNPLYGKLWLLIWAYNFNVIAIILEAIAFYLYFVSSFDFLNIYRQVLKLLQDLSVPLNIIPGIVWLVVGYIILDKYRRSAGLNNLHHMEMMDRGFINERSICVLICGTMGKKKTTILTDMALSTEAMFRDKAFEKILEADLKFPNFPWINLELAVKQAMESHRVYNLASCKEFIKWKRIKFRKHPHMKNIFYYNYKRYGTKYNNALAVEDVWDVIDTYVQLYFIYVIESSLMVSNYSIRTDHILRDIGNFPLWDSDFFSRDARYMAAFTRHAHILDMDMLRLGRKIIEDNPKKDMFEFGVVCITEIGKERGNSLELQQVKKNADETNQKNDGFNNWLKMCRHSATVDNYPFIRVFVDDQRPESWGADARDLTEILNIDECSEFKLTMPFFNMADYVISRFLNKFRSKYSQYRYERGDNTLGMYLYHSLASKINHHHKTIFNTYGYYKLDILLESGRQDGKVKKANYYLMAKKIYSLRFSTDCFSEFFNEKAMRSTIGLDESDEFKENRASFEEMQSMHSYFFEDLTRLRTDNNDTNKKTKNKGNMDDF